MQRIRVLQMIGPNGAIQQKTFGAKSRGRGARNRVDGLIFITTRIAVVAQEIINNGDNIRCIQQKHHYLGNRESLLHFDWYPLYLNVCIYP